MTDGRPKIFAATISIDDYPYKSAPGSPQRVFYGKDGYWVVYDVKDGLNGYYGRMVKDVSGHPDGFVESLDNDQVYGYIKEEGLWKLEHQHQGKENTLLI